MDDQRPRSPFLAQVRDALRARNCSLRTEQAYLLWVRRFIRFHRLRHPREMAEPEVAEFLSYLAVDRQVAPNTQAQALNALVFLYRHVPQRPLGEIPGTVRAHKKQRVPVVLTLLEVGQVLRARAVLSPLCAALGVADDGVGRAHALPATSTRR